MLSMNRRGRAWRATLRDRWLGFVHRAGLDAVAYRLWRYAPAGLGRLVGHHRFDRRYGLATRGYDDPRYEPTPETAFARIVEALPVDPRRFVFVDVGSGKGKVVLLATRLPFRRIVGVERFADLHAVAVENLRRWPREEMACPRVELVLADAATWTPPAEPTILYLFDPFDENVLARLLANVEASLAGAPRPLYVAFYSTARRGAPWDRRRRLDEATFLETIVDEPTFSIYRAIAPPRAPAKISIK